MNIWCGTTKVFAFFLVIFVNFSAVKAQGSIYELQAGTKIRVQMDNEINSLVSGVNDTFTATVAEPVRVRETVVLPAGAVIEGRVTKVERPSMGGKAGSLSVRFETLRLANGEKRDIEGVLVNELKAETPHRTNVLSIIGATAAGALLGAVSQAENGILIGAGIGAGVGTGAVVLRKGKNVRIKTDEKFEIELTRKVTLPVQDY